jgi:hypothetical protein
MNEPVPTGTVAKRGVFMVAGIAGSVVLTVLGALPSIFGIAAGILALVLGAGALASKDPGDRVPGLVCTAAGILAILARLPFLGGIAGWFLGAGAFALLALGIWNGVKFFLGLKSRS